MVNRKQVKWQMVFDRGGVGAVCDLCGKNVGHEQHEIINRGRTVGNEEAREASYDKRLCSLLCAACHTVNNLAERNEQALLAHNFDLYGREMVLAAIESVASLLHLPLELDIPEETDLE